MSGSRVDVDVTSVTFGTLGVEATSSVWENERTAFATVTLGGTFGGATAVIEGADAVGGPYATLIGMGGAASFTAPGLAQIDVLPRFWRVRTIGGAGTAVTAVATLNLIQRRTLPVGLSLDAITNGNLAAPAVPGAVNLVEVFGGATGAPGRVGIRAIGSDANVSLILSPQGLGALMAAIPDSAIAGGNARGANAVDWQQSRIAASQVASGVNAVICGGANNTANGTNSTVTGGSANTASGVSSLVAGGNANAASALAATVGGGNANTASGVTSWVPGGNSATTRGVVGRGAWAASRITSAGDAQCGEHPLLRQTTDATATRLTADNAAASTTNTINLPSFAAYSGVLTVVSKAAGSTAAATWRVNVSAVRGNGAGTTAVYEGAGAAIVPTASSGVGSAWRLDIAADTTNGGIAVTVTGAAGTTINHSARFANVEAATAS